MEPIRYVESVGGYSIAYQVVGDGPLDIVFVHGWVCSFQPGWEWPALASFYRRLAGMGRLILFDKRGTGLSDRVLGIASLEERMDDVRAVMDAVGAERAAVIGVSEGGPMCTLFAATHPDRTPGAGHAGRLRARATGRRTIRSAAARSRTAGCGRRAEQWGRYAARRFLDERAPSIADDEEAIDWYTSYLVRGASPSAVAAITDMNEEIDVRHVLATVRVPALVMYRAQEYLREASRYMGERLPGARVVERPGRRPPAWEGDQDVGAGRDRAFLGGLREAPVEPGLILTTVLEAEVPGVRAGAGALGVRPLPRARARRARAAACARASTARPARSAARARWRASCPRCAPASTPASASCATAGSPARRWRSPRASPAPRAPGEILATSTVQDLVAGSGIEFSEHGRVTLDRADGACSQSCYWAPPVRRTLSSTSRACGRSGRSGGGRPRRRCRARGAEARTSSQWSAPGQPASSQRPSGDHSRSRSRPGAVRTVSPSTRTVVWPRCRRRARGGAGGENAAASRSAPRQPGRVALAAGEVVDRPVAEAGDQQPAAVGRPREVTDRRRGRASTAPWRCRRPRP